MGWPWPESEGEDGLGSGHGAKMRWSAWELSKQALKSDALGSVPTVSLLCGFTNSLICSMSHMSDLGNESCNTIDLIGLVVGLNN